VSANSPRRSDNRLVAAELERTWELALRRSSGEAAEVSAPQQPTPPKPSHRSCKRPSARYGQKLRNSGPLTCCLRRSAKPYCAVH